MSTNEHLDAIRKLAVQLGQHARGYTDAYPSPLVREIGERAEALAGQLDAERARVVRLQRYARSVESVSPPNMMADALIDSARLDLQPGDLPDEEATR